MYEILILDIKDLRNSNLSPKQQFRKLKPDKQNMS